MEKNDIMKFLSYKEEIKEHSRNVREKEVCQLINKNTVIYLNFEMFVGAG